MIRRRYLILVYGVAAWAILGGLVFALVSLIR